MPAVVGLLLLLGIVSPSCRADPAGSQVLVLQSYHQGQRWSDLQLDGIREALDSSGRPYALYVEHLDTKRWADDTYLNSFRQLLIAKYSSVLLDAIVVTDNSTFNLIRAHRDDLFGQVPVVFSGVNFFRRSMRDGLQQMTGVAETFDAAATIQLMLRLHPATRRVVIVIDDTTTGTLLLREPEPVLDRFNADLRFDVWNDRTLPTLQQDLARLRDGDLVLLMPFARDAAGKHVEFREAAEIVSGATSVPVYGTWDFFLGHGIVGGRLTTAIGQGESAGRLLRRVLDGEDAGDIAVRRVGPTEFQFDARQLERHGIEEGDLPEGTRVFYRSWLAEHGMLIGLVVTLALLSLRLLPAWYRKRAENHAAERKLRQNERRFRDFFESSPDATWIIEDAAFIDCNRAAMRMLGYDSKEQLVAVGPADLSPPEQPDGQASRSKAVAMMALAHAHGIHRFEWVHRKRSGDDFWTEVTLSRLDDGHRCRLYCVWRDISERKQADAFMRQHAQILEKRVAERTEALERALLDAEQANAAKSQFLANVSHELRTPMHAILSYVQLARKHAEGDRIARYLDNILTSGGRLTSLLNDLLDLSSLEAGGVRARIENNDLHAVAAGAIGELQVLAGEKDIHLELVDEVKAELSFDAEMMLRVLVNVLSNAIKFSAPATTVTLALRPQGADDTMPGAGVEILVTDSGVGIPAAQIEVVFDKFVQSDATRGNGGGTGLGLAICKEIVTLHHGRIWAVSPPHGQACGTAIHIVLPAKAASDASGPLGEAIQAHERWMTLMERRINGRLSSAQVSAATVAKPQVCHLGRWIAQQKHQGSAARVPLSLDALDDAHRQLHEMAGSLVAKVDAGESPADGEIAAFRAASQRVARLLQPTLQTGTKVRHRPSQRTAS